MPGGSTSVTNYLSAVTPEIWSRLLQIPLYKSLVSFDVCNLDMRAELTYGDIINKQYFGSLSAMEYTPGTAVSAESLSFATDQITVDKKYHVTYYVDDMEQLQANIPLIQSMVPEAAYQLRDKIDGIVFRSVTAGVPMDSLDLGGGTASALITATTGNVIRIFSDAREELRKLNVEEGDWIAIIDPTRAQLIEQEATSVGYNVADATLRNGYIGDFMGFQIYVSNNMMTGETLSALATRGISGSGSGTDLYFGRRGCIELIIQQDLKTSIREVSDKGGSNILTTVLFGKGVCTKNASRFLDAQVWTAAGA